MILQRLVVRASVHWLRYSESFDDGNKLLAAPEPMGLEDVVSKLRDGRYRSGSVGRGQGKVPGVEGGE
jgi:ATP-dependent DNA ligase